MRAYLDVWFTTQGDEAARAREVDARLESLRALSGVKLADRTLDAADEYLLVVEVPGLEELDALIRSVEDLPNLTVHRARVARPH